MLKDATISSTAIAGETPAKGGQDRGLLLVGLFKLSKALFFTAVGVGAYKLINVDLGDLVMHIVERVHDVWHFDPEGRFVSFVLNKADLIGHHQLRQAGMLAIAYAIVCLIEGIGLIRRKVWAEYLTVVLTTGALPWEFYEIVHHFTWLKVGVILTNLLILLYLIWILKRKRDRDGVAVLAG